MTGEPRGPSHSRFARLHPKTYLGVQGIVGLILAVGSAWIFLAIADEVPEKGFMMRADAGVAAWLQSHGTEYGESIFAGISLLGSQVLMVVLIATALFFVYRRDWRHLIMIAVTGGGGALLNVGLKDVYHRARPSFAAEFPVSSWSFPSGHAMDSLIAYGILAYWLAERFPARRWLIGCVAAALVFAIGYARIYLGVHYLSDVIAGFTAGLLWLTVCITAYRFADHRRVGPSGTDEA